MNETAATVVTLVLWVGVPGAGLAAAVLLGTSPSSAFARWWVLAYSLIAIAVTFVLAVRFWSPDDDVWNGLHILALALAADALAVSWIALRTPPSERSYNLFRGLAALACVVSAAAVFLAVGAGSGL